MNVARELEGYARWVRKNRRLGTRDSSRAAVETRIVLLLERIEHFTGIHGRQIQGLLHEECELGTGLLRLQSNEIRHNCHLTPAKDTLKQKLFKNSESRRRLTNKHEKHIAEILDRLSEEVRLHKMLGRAFSQE